MGKVKPIRERLLRRREIDANGCWVWTGSKARGYGYLICVEGGRRVNRYVHRLAYEEFVGPIPHGLVIDHLCRNPPCFNPAHLRAVTQAENVLAGESLMAQQARQTTCKRGHPFDEVNTGYHSGHRYCRTCENARRRSQKGVWNKHKTHCKHGHEYTPENTIRSTGGHRKCRTCAKTSRARFYAEKGK